MWWKLLRSGSIQWSQNLELFWSKPLWMSCLGLWVSQSINYVPALQTHHIPMGQSSFPYLLNMLASLNLHSGSSSIDFLKCKNVPTVYKLLFWWNSTFSASLSHVVSLSLIYFMHLVNTRDFHLNKMSTNILPLSKL